MGRRVRKVACLSGVHDADDCDSSVRPPTAITCKQPSCEPDVTKLTLIVKQPKMRKEKNEIVQKKNKSFWKRGNWSKVRSFHCFNMIHF